MKSIKYTQLIFQTILTRSRNLQVEKIKSRKFTTSKPHGDLIGAIRKFWVGLFYPAPPPPPPPPPPPTLIETFLTLPMPILFATFFFTFALIAIPPIISFTHRYDTPISGRRRFLMFTPNQFEHISNEIYKMYLSSHKGEVLQVSQPEYEVVKRVTNRLIKASSDIEEISKKQWSITIIDRPYFNIIALPTGQIIIFKGMLNLCNTDDNLAAVLAHEMVHGAMAHSAELLKKLHFYDKFILYIFVTIWSVFKRFPDSLLKMTARKLKKLLLTVPYNTVMETEVDKVALRITAIACYDVRESSALWGKMDAIENIDSKRRVDWVYMHPDDHFRAQRLGILIPKAIQIRTEMKCPPVPAHDPRRDVEKFRENLINQALYSARSSPEARKSKKSTTGSVLAAENVPTPKSKRL